MKHAIRLFSLLGVVIGLSMGGAACGKGLPKLTDPQKAQVAQTLDDFGRVHRAVPRPPHSLESRASAGYQAAPALGWAGMGEDSSSIPGKDSNEAEMRAKISRGMDDRLCEVGVRIPVVDPSMPQGPLPPDNYESWIQVTGRSCPVSLDLAIWVKAQDASTSKATFHFNYSVRDESYRRLNDVDAAELSGEILARGEERRSEAHGEITGTIHSQKKGDVKVRLDVDLSGNPDNARGEVVLRMEFSDFTAELKQESDGGRARFFMNGEEVSEREFNRYFDGATRGPRN